MGCWFGSARACHAATTALRVRKRSQRVITARSGTPRGRHAMAETDIRIADQDLAALSRGTLRRLGGYDCASCGAVRPLRRGGWAYGLNPVSGARLGYRVRVCPRCPARLDRVGAPAPVIAWTAALAWAVAAGARESAVFDAWRAGRCADVPIGRLWDVAQFTRTLGLDAVSRLHADGVPLGPVLEVPLRATVEVLVRAGTARHWPGLLGTYCIGVGKIRCPAPQLTRASGHRAASGRHWIVPPGRAAQVTDAEALVERAATATVHRSRSWLAELPSSAGAVSRNVDLD